MYKFELVRKLSDLKTGDQIAVSGHVDNLHPSLGQFMRHTDGVYFHHGIFDEERMEVIDVHGDKKFNAKPKRRSIHEFVARRSQLYRVIHENCLPVETTMMMANKALTRWSFWPPVYDLISNNCETFANYLKTGIKYSSQASAAVSNFFNISTATVPCAVPVGSPVVHGSASVSSLGGPR